MIGWHDLKYLEISIGEKYTPIISPGCYNKTKSTYALFITYQSLFKYIIYYFTWRPYEVDANVPISWNQNFETLQLFPGDN